MAKVNEIAISFGPEYTDRINMAAAPCTYVPLRGVRYGRPQ